MLEEFIKDCWESEIQKNIWDKMNIDWTNIFKNKDSNEIHKMVIYKYIYI